MNMIVKTARKHYILILIVIFALCVCFASAVAKTDSLNFQVCSFAPETPPPTWTPQTPIPTTEGPTTEGTTIPDVTTTTPAVTTTPEVTTTPDVTTTSNPEVTTTPELTATTTPEATATPDDEITTTTSTTSSTTPEGKTTPEDNSATDDSTELTTTTTKTTTAAATTTEPTISEDDSTTDLDEEENKPVVRGMKDENNDEDDEKLVNKNNKRLLLGYNEWPIHYTDEVIIQHTKDALKEYFQKIGFTATVNDDSITVLNQTNRNEEYNGNVTYTITLSITFEDTLQNTWEGIKANITAKQASTLYEYFSSKTENDLMVCSAPERIRDPAPCDYGKTYYQYFTTTGEKNEIVSPKEKADEETYEITCKSNDYVKPNNSNGNITVTVGSDEKSTVYCNVKCMAPEYRPSYNQLSFKVTEYSPSINKKESVFKSSVNSGDKFSTSIKMQYPSVDGDKPTYSLKLTLSISNKNGKNCTLEGTTTTTNENDLKLTDLSITCTDIGANKLELLYLITGKENNGDKSTDIQEITINRPITVIVKPPVIEPTTQSPPEDGTEDVTTPPAPTGSKTYIYSCKDPNQKYDDYTGLCCERNEGYGETCTLMDISFPFTSTTDTATSLSADFRKSYLTMLRRYVFHKSNFNFDVKEPQPNSIDITVHFYLNHTFGYDGNEDKLVRRSLQEGMDWSALSSPYTYIKTVISYVEPSAVADDKTEDLPEELQKIPENVIQQIKDIKEEAPKQAAVVTVEHNVVIDLDAGGIDVVESVADDVEPPVVQVVYVPEEPTPQPPKPTSDTSDDKWAKKYWYVILIICLAVVIILAIVGVAIYVSINTANGNFEKQKIQKNTKNFTENVIPIEKIKQENEVTDDDIYKPFSYEILKEGYLLKEGHDRVIDKWQRRYFVLYFEPAAIRIYESMVPSYYGKVYLGEKQSIPLDCYNGIEYESGNKDFTIVLKVRDSSLKSYQPGDEEKKVHLKVPDEFENGEEIARDWVECIKNYKQQKPKVADAWTRPLLKNEKGGIVVHKTRAALDKKNAEVASRFERSKTQITNA